MREGELCVMVKAGLWKNNKLKSSDVFFDRMLTIGEVFP